MFLSEKITYATTKSFSKLVLDYVAGDAALQSFYNFSPNNNGFAKAIEERKHFPVNRKLLVEVLKKQYAAIGNEEKVTANIELLLNNDTFTITTAHQPNIFTGHLYFFYKIVHAIKLAVHLKEQFPQQNFVPVFYMGSEDADVEELGEVTIKEQTLHWKTTQTGAVGNMLVDDELLALLQQMASLLKTEPYAEPLLQNLQHFFAKGETIEQATFKLVNYLFGKYGLLVVLPNNAALKQTFNAIVSRELLEQFSEKAVIETIAQFPAQYKVQASGRAINLFYLKDNFRERIEQQSEKYTVVNTNISFSKEEILRELEKYPERFSANVVLRPVYQEIILPNVAFIGGGGEIAYWLELQKVFKEANAFFPILVLRNSFSLIDTATHKKITRLSLNNLQLFATELEVINGYVKQHAKHELNLNTELEKLQAIYIELESKAAAIDATLSKHVKALQAKAEKRLQLLQKKMLKAEKKHFDWQQEHISKIRKWLFPNNNLQERVANGLEYVAKYSPAFIDELLMHSNAFEPQFTILTEKDNG
jgi:bacillithiol synthase